jgi:hypothetical protein
VVAVHGGLSCRALRVADVGGAELDVVQVESSSRVI